MCLSTYRMTVGVNTNLVVAYVDLHRQWQGCSGVKDQGMRSCGGVKDPNRNMSNADLNITRVSQQQKN